MPHTVCSNNCTAVNGFVVFCGKNGYMAGFKYCSVCNRGIKTNMFTCKCCKNRLRSSSRGRTN